MLDTVLYTGLWLYTNTRNCSKPIIFAINVYSRHTKEDVCLQKILNDYLSVKCDF